jgi:hypothetical protein
MEIEENTEEFKARIKQFQNAAKENRYQDNLTCLERQVNETGAVSFNLLIASLVLQLFSPIF